MRLRQREGMCARLLNKIHTVKCIGSRVSKGVIVLSAHVPVILAIYLHVLSRAVIDRDLT